LLGSVATEDAEPHTSTQTNAELLIELNVSG
jgi:hypothetical protein